MALDSIKAFFAEPLSPSKQEALHALFALDFDAVAMELNLTGFEHDAFQSLSSGPVVFALRAA
jgi:hypothetical protein